MGDPYTSVSVSGYNSNPPADDGSQVEANRVKWSTIKTKLPDPIKAALESMNAGLLTAFAKVVGGGGITSTAINYSVIATDQGKLVRATASGITITTPDATDVDDPFVFGVLNNSTGDITIDGHSAQTIDGAASVILPAGTGILVFTDGSNWFTTGQNFQRTQIPPQGRLTLVSGSPVISSDQESATAIYYTPYAGNLIPIPDGTNFDIQTFSELALTLHANHATNTLYDVFVFEDSGALVIGTGPAWSTLTSGSGARGTGAGTTELVRLKGLHVNNVAMTARNGGTTYSVGAKCGIYLGTIYIDGVAGQVTCHISAGQARKWGVWNAYNRRPITLKTTDTGGGSDTIGTTPGPICDDSTNTAILLAGLAEESFRVVTRATAAVNSSGNLQSGVGWNVTNAFSGFAGAAIIPSTGNINTSFGEHTAPAAIGIQTATHLLAYGGSATATVTANEIGNLMTAVWNG